MKPDENSKIKQRLLQQKKEVLLEVHRLQTGLEDSLRETTGELAAYDNHPADLGSETFERSKDTALLDHASQLLAQIDRALHKIEEGSYGVCESCGDRIPTDRLNAVPYAQTCLTCQEEVEAGREGRPLEEEVLSLERFFSAPESLLDALEQGSSDFPTTPSSGRK